MRGALTDEGIEIHALARTEARRLRHSWLGCEHLLLGLVAMREAPASRIITEQGADLESLRREISVRLAPEQTQPSERLGLTVTPRATVVLALANVEAERLGARAVGSEHILLALLTEGESLGLAVLLALNVDIDNLAFEVLSVLDVPTETRIRYLRERQTGPSGRLN
jgi:ATP-dependent Clp protease ATP-binding subunit ClpC